MDGYASHKSLLSFTAINNRATMQFPQTVLQSCSAFQTRNEIHFDGLIQSGAVTNYAELARLGNVTRARITQIMNLLMLAPEIQEELLFLPRVERGRDDVLLRDVQSVAAVVEWEGQRSMIHYSRTVSSPTLTSVSLL